MTETKAFLRAIANIRATGAGGLETSYWRNILRPVCDYTLGGYARIWSPSYGVARTSPAW